MLDGYITESDKMYSDPLSPLWGLFLGMPLLKLHIYTHLCSHLELVSFLSTLYNYSYLNILGQITTVYMCFMESPNGHNTWTQILERPGVWRILAVFQEVTLAQHFPRPACLHPHCATILLASKLFTPHSSILRLVNNHWLLVLYLLRIHMSWMQI